MLAFATAAALSAAVASAYVGAAALTKRLVLDRGAAQNPEASARRDHRREAVEQARALTRRDRVAAGVPTGGQFAAHSRTDGDVSL